MEDYGMHMDSISLFFGEPLFKVTTHARLTTSSEMACHDPCDPHYS